MHDIQQIIDRLGVEHLSEMQNQLLTVATSSSQNVILLSPTGTGKTLAYLLSLYMTISADCPEVQAVIVVPSRELALQSDELLRRMKTEIRSLCLIGGHATADETRSLREIKPQIVFATPGRLNDHLQRGSINVAKVAQFIIDEFDKCLDLGFADEMMSIRRQLPQVLRTWLISATNDESRFAEYLDLSHTARVDYTQQSADNRIEYFVVKSPVKDKLETLGQLLTSLKGAPTIVFVSHRESAERVTVYLKSEKFYAEKYHGGLEQRDRERSLYKFRSGGSNVLVATDLAARGLDVVEVRNVVHYHLPADAVAFEHRNGRSTRWDNRGSSYFIIGPEEELPPFLPTDCPVIDDLDHRPISPTAPQWVTVYIGRGKRDKLSKGDVAGFFCKKGGLRGDDIGRIDVGPHYAYLAIKRSKARAALRAIAGEKIKGMKTLIEEMH